MTDGAVAPAAAERPPAPSWLRRRLRSASRFSRFMVQNTALMTYIKYFQRKTYEPGRVTVITATYNRPDKLREAIESVRAQTYQNWEQIIVSDGPDPRVDALVREIGDPRVRSFSTSRLPVMGNYQRNYALKHATGEFVLYLDDDNIIYPHCLQTMVAGFDSEQIGFVVSPIHYGDTIKDPQPGFAYREIDLLNYMVRRRLVEKVGGQRVHAIADYLLIRDIAAISKGNFLKELIGHHR
jgi:glycosyltransferase involved in cell wall biosynthesis